MMKVLDRKELISFNVNSLPTSFHGFDSEFLYRTIISRMVSIGIEDLNDYIDMLNNLNEELILIDMLSNSHSLFFRNTLTFSILESIYLPMLISDIANNKTKELRIWSTACASGQEAYSLAILLEELKIKTNIDFKYRIFATDLSEEQIEIAKEGLFSIMRLKNTSLERIEKWFIPEGEKYRINPLLKENIIFSTFDLLNKHSNFPEESVYGDFNIIICANLLFYYSTSYQKRILSKLRKLLLPNGYFICGEVERGIVNRHGFIEKYPYSAIYKVI